MAIDVFFAGLMLICLDGQNKENCPYGEYNNYPNTALVVKANGPSKICGWHSTEETSLTMKFAKDDFTVVLGPGVDCKEVGTDKICELTAKKICLIPYPYAPTNNALDSSLGNLPRIDEIDRRWIASNNDLLKNTDYVPSSLNFPHGTIAAGSLWPTDVNPTRWYRSDGDTDGVLPRTLSDRLKVGYKDANQLTVTDCKNPLITLSNGDGKTVTFQNFTKGYPTPDYDDADTYDSLAYLLWYYQLGVWDTNDGLCPHYTRAKKDAVLLRCVSKRDTGCAYDTRGQRDHTFWPPMLGPRF